MFIRVSGEALAGEITSIIGSSGSGKSLLLKCLCGRVAQSRDVTLSGCVLVDGREVLIEKVSYISDQVSLTILTLCPLTLLGYHLGIHPFPPPHRVGVCVLLGALSATPRCVL